MIFGGSSTFGPYERGPYRNGRILPGDPAPGEQAQCQGCGLDFTQDDDTGARLCEPCLAKRTADLDFRLDYPHRLPYSRAERVIRPVGKVLVVALIGYFFLLPMARGIVGLW